MTLLDLKRTVARTSGPGLPVGTAFILSATHALTCAHCVTDATGRVVKEVNLQFTMWHGDIEATVEGVDTDRDCALLRLTKPPAYPAGPRARTTVNGKKWQAFGYPKTRGSSTAIRGLTIGGEVVDIDARTGQDVERQVIHLRCYEAADALHGASGSPVFVDGVIVGMITNQPQKWGKATSGDKGETEPVYDALFALSLAQIAEARKFPTGLEWNFVDADRSEEENGSVPTETELFQLYLEIIESIPKLSSTKVHGSQGAVETVPLELIYVEHEVSGLARLDDIWRRKRVAVVAEDGFGKGTFLKYLQLRLLRNAIPDEAARLWPLYVELDRYAQQDDHLDLVDFALEDLLRGGQQEPLQAHLKARNLDGRLVLFCDGLERVDAHYDRVVDALSRQPRYVIALRPGQRTDVGQEAGGTLRLQPFDQRRIGAFVSRWFDVIAPKSSTDEARVMEEIANQPSLLELAGVPRFLGLICAVLYDGQTAVATRTALISAAWSTVWQAALGGDTFARRKSAAKALQRLARNVFERPASRKREFDEDELYQALADEGALEPDIVVGKLVDHEIIVPGRDSHYASPSYRFLFDTFQDYLVAEHLANDAAFFKALPSLQIEGRWTRILPVVTGILGRTEKQLPVLRDFLATLGALTTGEALGLHVCLVAECLAEVHDTVLPALSPFLEQTESRLLQVWTEQQITRTHILPWVRRLRPAGMRRGLEGMVADTTVPVERRAAAVFALSVFRDQAARETLMGRAQHDVSSSVRVSACLGLAYLKHPDADDALIDSLRDPDFQVRMIAARCIAGRGNRELAARVLTAWMDGIGTGLKNEFLNALSIVTWTSVITSLRPEAIVPLLLETLTSGNAAGHFLAASVLTETGTRAGVWPAAQLLESESTESNLKQVVAQMLIRLGSDAAIAALRRAFSRDDLEAKLGAMTGFAAIETIRNTPVADLFMDPTDASITWSVIRPIEMDIFEAQAANTLQSLQEAIDVRGRVAILNDARAEFSRSPEAASVPPGQPDPLADMARVFSPQTDDLRRVAAFETVQLLDPDPELLIDALFDTDTPVVLRASVWIRARRLQLPIQALLKRLDEFSDTFSLGYGGAIAALARLEHLGILLGQLRERSRAAANAIWVLSVQYGFRVYEDGRIELPDGQLESDAARAAERLRTIDETASRQRDTIDDAASSLDSARADYLAGLDTEPDDAPGWASRGVIEFLLDKNDEALTSLDAAIRTDEKMPLWPRLRGWVHHEMENYQEAAADREQTISLGDIASARYVDLGDSLTGAKQFERAIEAFSTALEREPGSSDALYGRAFASVHLSQNVEAMRDLDAFLAQHPGHENGTRLREYAQKQLETRPFLQPAAHETWDGHLARARQLLVDGDLGAAHTEAKQVILADALHPNARALRARVWIEQGHPAFAIIDLTDLVARSPDRSAQEGILAALDELLEMPGMTRVLTAQQQADALGVHGAVLAALEIWDRARVELEQAIGSGATDWMILNALAWLYADHFKINFERASELAQTALDRLVGAVLVTDEDRASVLHSLGVSYLGSGRFEDAEKSLQQAASLSPGNAHIETHLDAAKGRGV